MEPKIGYLIVAPYIRGIYINNIKDTKEAAIKYFLDTKCASGNPDVKKWSYWEARGYKLVTVKTSVIDPE